MPTPPPVAPQIVYIEKPAKAKSGCGCQALGCLVTLLIVAVIVLCLAGGAGLAILGKKLEGSIADKGPSIMAIAHPTATYQSCQYLGFEFPNDEQVRFDFDIEYLDKVFTGQTYYLRLQVFIDQGYLRNQQIHHWAYGRDTGPVPPGAALNALQKLLTE